MFSKAHSHHSCLCTLQYRVPSCKDGWMDRRTNSYRQKGSNGCSWHAFIAWNFSFDPGKGVARWLRWESFPISHQSNLLSKLFGEKTLEFPLLCAQRRLLLRVDQYSLCVVLFSGLIVIRFQLNAMTSWMVEGRNGELVWFHGGTTECDGLVGLLRVRSRNQEMVHRDWLERIRYRSRTDWIQFRQMWERT